MKGELSALPQLSEQTQTNLTTKQSKDAADIHLGIFSVIRNNIGHNRQAGDQSVCEERARKPDCWD